MPTDLLDIPLFYDFASTIGYVTHRVMERMADEPPALGVNLSWRPLDVARVTGWPRGALVAAATGRARTRAA